MWLSANCTKCVILDSIHLHMLPHNGWWDFSLLISRMSVNAIEISDRAPTKTIITLVCLLESSLVWSVCLIWRRDANSRHLHVACGGVGGGGGGAGVTRRGAPWVTLSVSCCLVYVQEVGGWPTFLLPVILLSINTRSNLRFLLLFLKCSYSKIIELEENPTYLYH